jgi:phage shock protein E
MIRLLKKLLGLAPKTDWRKLVKDGAQVIDVRSPGEFNSGHIPGSVNIPLPNMVISLSGIARNKPVIVCCTSGMRSASAKRILKANGFQEVYNGGGWRSLLRRIG